MAAGRFTAAAWLTSLALLMGLEGRALAQDVSAEVVRDLAPSGHLRAAINFGNPVLAQKDPVDGRPRGVSADLARELAGRLGVPVDFVAFDGAGQVFDAVRTHAWDVAFLAVDPVRAAGIDFTPPYVVIEGTYVVPRTSPIETIEAVDRDGVRIAVGRGSAYDLYLTRTLKHAILVRSATSAQAIDAFAKGGFDAAAGVRQPLAAFAATHADVRLIPGRFMAIEQAMGAPKGHEEGRLFLTKFVEEMKANGFIARALKASGQGDAEVAPPAADK